MNQLLRARSNLDGGKYTGNRNIRKTAKNTGQSYATQSSKIVKKRKLRPLEAGRMKSRERLEEEYRLPFFEEYWTLGSRDKRVSFCPVLLM